MARARHADPDRATAILDIAERLIQRPGSAASPTPTSPPNWA